MKTQDQSRKQPIHQEKKGREGREIHRLFAHNSYQVVRTDKSSPKHSLCFRLMLVVPYSPAPDGLVRPYYIQNHQIIVPHTSKHLPRMPNTHNLLMSRNGLRNGLNEVERVEKVLSAGWYDWGPIL